ncbi:PREDICTED: uncharacterized protein LOC109153770 [Ipomoea nil]|uniref:uncharacterized protein LOC109153770 n=1 Tax=Ipomoea nil TaxID=35883 RepID=UPI000901E855|nr:PREDICTED: uncharacterized protein LOC109153770 [Ipomoea nil]
MPPRQRARTPETPTNEQLAQNLHQLTQTMDTLSEALLHNNHPVPPPQPAGHRDIGRLVSSHRPPTFAGEEDPVVLEEWVRTFGKIFSVVGCPEERRVELATFYFSHEADLWWVHESPACLEEPGFDWFSLKDRMRERFYPAYVRAVMYEEFLHLQQGSSSVVEYHKKFLELAKVEKFVAGLNYGARKALTVSSPSSLKEAYLSAADLYRVQQLQRGSYELARKRTESGGSSNFKRPKPSFQAKNTLPPTQGSNKVEHGNQVKTFACRIFGKVHAGQSCNGFVSRCFRCGEKGHKIAECPQQVNQRAVPRIRRSSMKGSSSRGASGARPLRRVFLMGRSQAEAEGLVEEELAGNPFLAYPCL